MALAKIVYASMTGNNEEIADIVAAKLQELGHTVDMEECSAVVAHDFEDADLAILISYTYGDGDLPDEIVDLYDDLEDLDLSGKVFGVAGSGDTFYDYFCKAVDDFEQQLTKTGATKGAASVKIDLAAEEADIERLEAFAQELSDSLSVTATNHDQP